MHCCSRLLLPLRSLPAPAARRRCQFQLVNGTGGALGGSVDPPRRDQDWKPLGAAPSAGARGSMQFSDPDCAFDIRATVAGGGPVTWAGVNLCDVKSVTLNRDESAGAWVDYDQ